MDLFSWQSMWSACRNGDDKHHPDQTNIAGIGNHPARIGQGIRKVVVPRLPMVRKRTLLRRNLGYERVCHELYRRAKLAYYLSVMRGTAPGDDAGVFLPAVLHLPGLRHRAAAGCGGLLHFLHLWLGALSRNPGAAAEQPWTSGSDKRTPVAAVLVKGKAMHPTRPSRQTAGTDSGFHGFSDGVFERLMRSSPVAIVVTNARTGRILDVNDAFLNLFHYDRIAVLGKTSQDLGMWRDRGVRSLLPWKRTPRSVTMKRN
jgi:PAS domain-containing protein